MKNAATVPLAYIQTLLKQATDALQTASDSARLDAEVLLAHALGKDRSYLYTWPERTPDATVCDAYMQYVERRAGGCPVAYITGIKEFWSMPFVVTTDTLVPRSDTETLVQLAIDQLSTTPGPVLDLGTGCGAIAISIAKAMEDNSAGNQQIDVWATDNSVMALDIARNNARRLNTTVTFRLSYWFQHLQQIPEGGWQLIVSNPPYLATDDAHLATLAHEPRQALVAADDGLADITEIAQCARNYLRTDGRLMIEHGVQQGHAVRTIFQKAGYRNVQTYTDIAGRDRVTAGQIV